MSIPARLHCTHPVALCLMILVLGAAAESRAASQVDVFTFDNETQRERYRVLIEELRCPKCLNTNIAGSDAPIAQDLRALVHRQIVQEGMSDQQILDFVHARYGDFVLYDPPFNQRTWLLWLLPVGVAVLVIGVLVSMVRRGAQHKVRTLDDTDRARLAALSGEE